MSQEPNPGIPLGGAFDPARFINGMARSGHNGMMGMTYRAHGNDWVELDLPYREDLIGDPSTEFRPPVPADGLFALQATTSSFDPGASACESGLRRAGDAPI